MKLHSIILLTMLVVLVIASVLTFIEKTPKITISLCGAIFLFWFYSLLSWAENAKQSLSPRVSWYLGAFMVFYGSITYLFSLMYYSAATLGFKLVSAESFIDYLYFSVITVTTLGYGDIKPLDTFTKCLSMIEVSFGVIFLAAILTVVLSLSESVKSEA